MIVIVNKANTVEIDFNDYAASFDAAKVSIDKGAGNRLYLSRDKSYTELIYAADGEKVVLEQGSFAIFQKQNGGTFTDMEQLFDYLMQCMEDRTGGVV